MRFAESIGAASEMAVESARPDTVAPVSWPRLPERIPDLKQPWLNMFQLLWFAALLLAVVGPIGGTLHRWKAISENSALMLGSRIGLVLSHDDLTQVRFPVGSAAKAAGVRPGDDIVAIDGTPIAKVVPISERGMAQPHDATEADYALFANIVEGGDETEMQITLRSADGAQRDFRVRPGEQHIEEAARGLGLPGGFLRVFDLLHVLTYPFLLLAAWILQRRKPEDLLSSLLSLAILLTIAAEQPSATFLRFVLQVPHLLHQTIYDLGNICLLLGILLFPFGALRPRVVVALCALLPVLLFLEGNIYRLVFMLFMAAGVATLLARMHRTATTDARQQIKWALFGFTGYTMFLAVSLLSDMAKLGVGSFGTQLTLEVLGGFTLGLAFLSLQMGLLVALLRFRLYDAEVVISRSATVALVTITIGGIFAATSEAVKEITLNLLGRDAGSAPVIFAAAVATVLVEPARDRISGWSERKFQRKLVELRNDLPEVVRDLRVTAPLPELLEEVLRRIQAGVRTTSVAVLIDGKVCSTRGIAPEEVAAWAATFNPTDSSRAICHAADRTFPIRIPLQCALGDGECLGWILVGPRPDCSIPSRDEQAALSGIVDPVSRAVKIVCRRDKRELEHALAMARHERERAIKFASCP